MVLVHLSYHEAGWGLAEPRQTACRLLERPVMAIHDLHNPHNQKVFLRDCLEFTANWATFPTSPDRQEEQTILQDPLKRLFCVRGTILLPSLYKSFLVPLLVFSRALIFAAIPLMTPQFPQNAEPQQVFYTVTSKAESPEVYVQHIRKYIPEYFLQEHPMADFDLVCLLLQFLGDSLLLSQEFPLLFVHLFTAPSKV